MRTSSLCLNEALLSLSRDVPKGSREYEFKAELSIAYEIVINHLYVNILIMGRIVKVISAIYQLFHSIL